LGIKKASLGSFLFFKKRDFLKKVLKKNVITFGNRVREKKRATEAVFKICDKLLKIGFVNHLI
jgi:hypothetical protein